MSLAIGVVFVKKFINDDWELVLLLIFIKVHLENDGAESYSFFFFVDILHLWNTLSYGVLSCMELRLSWVPVEGVLSLSRKMLAGKSRFR